MQRATIRTWFLIHKWTSIVCTLFLLMLCVTGLPLIFHHEIDELTEEAPAYGMPGVGSSGEAPGLQPLDAMLAKALAARPGEVPVFMAFDNDQPSMTVTTAPRPDSPAEHMTIQILDRSTGEATSTVDESGVDKGEGYIVDGIPPGAAGVYRLNHDVANVAALGDVAGIQR